MSGATTSYQTIKPIDKAQTEQHDSQRSPSHPLAHSDRDVGLRVVSGHPPRDYCTRHNLLLALRMPLITSCERPRTETTCDGVSDVLALFRAVTSIRTTAAVVGKAAAAMSGSGTQPRGASVAAWVSISPVARDRPSMRLATTRARVRSGSGRERALAARFTCLLARRHRHPECEFIHPASGSSGLGRERAESSQSDRHLEDPGDCARVHRLRHSGGLSLHSIWWFGRVRLRDDRAALAHGRSDERDQEQLVAKWPVVEHDYLGLHLLGGST